MAVHHITEKVLEGKPAFKDSEAYKDLEKRFADNEIFIAHNASFDADMLKKEGIEPTRVIDTLKIARYLDSNGKIRSYKLQYLRYLLGIEVQATAHDAFGDILVLEQLFYRLLKKLMEMENISSDTAIDQMLEISKKPILYKFFPFGKYKNQTIKDVAKNDRGYLKWLLNSKREDGENDEDWIFTLENALS
jgi:DNA polymerase III epsilon subunit-like protein